MIIANTIKGKGVSFMEDQVGWHGVATKDREQLDKALADLACPSPHRAPRSTSCSTSSRAVRERDGEARSTPSIPTFSRSFWWNDGDDMKVEMDPTRMGFGRALKRIGDDERIVTLHADISKSICITDFEADHPERKNRVFSVGIAEQNMMQVAAGLAQERQDSDHRHLRRVRLGQAVGPDQHHHLLRQPERQDRGRARRDLASAPTAPPTRRWKRYR